jgi:hypothetical protein
MGQLGRGVVQGEPFPGEKYCRSASLCPPECKWAARIQGSSVKFGQAAVRSIEQLSYGASQV